MRTLVRWHPRRRYAKNGREMDKLFNEFFGTPTRRSTPTNSDWGLALDVVENEAGFVVNASIPGINPDDIDITVSDRKLTIKGETVVVEADENETYHLRERRYGSFSRTLAMPKLADLDNVMADYEHGILTLHVPKLEVAQPKRVTINSRKVIEA